MYHEEFYEHMRNNYMDDDRMLLKIIIARMECIASITVAEK